MQPEKIGTPCLLLQVKLVTGLGFHISLETSISSSFSVTVYGPLLHGNGNVSTMLIFHLYLELVEQGFALEFPNTLFSIYLFFHV